MTENSWNNILDNIIWKLVVLKRNVHNAHQRINNCPGDIRFGGLGMRYGFPPMPKREKEILDDKIKELEEDVKDFKEMQKEILGASIIADKIKQLELLIEKFNKL